MAQLECILHTPDAGSCEEINPFTGDIGTEKWDRVKAAAAWRLETQKSSKYLMICRNLPEAPRENSGFHYTCFRRFASVPAECFAPEATTSNIGTTRRSQTSHLETTTTGVLPELCIFCNKKFIKVKQKKVALVSCEYDSAEKTKDSANILNDHHMLLKFGDIGFHSKEVKYHEKCRHDYLNSARDKSKRQGSNTEHNKLFDEALNSLFSYVQASIIDNKRPEYLASLHRRFENFLKEQLPEDVDIWQSRTLANKIVEHFGERVTIDYSSRKQGSVVFSNDTPRETALAMACNCNTMEEFTVLDAARILRSSVTEKIDCAPELPKSLSLEHFKSGQLEAPEILTSFFTTLLSGSHGSNELSSEVKRRVQSLSHDVLFCVSRGRLKPSKHLCMGVAMKSLTGSKSVVEILNRMGHSISYHVAESVETEVASSIVDQSRLLPDMLLQQSGLSTALAWDNYDELTETLSGKDTLHDTVGICYQNISTDDQVEETQRQHLHRAGATERANKRRRQFDAPERTIVPYKRRPSMSQFSYEVYSVETPIYCGRITKMNMVWMICCCIHTKTPMWRGWNSLVCHDPLPRQVIGYMENIELPPTRLDVVRETMARSQKVASECGDKYAVVTYDLAIAKPALQIQAQESPLFDNVFVCFGAFHIFMTYFACLGYFLESSGGPDILCGSDVLASGSMNGFIGGKHFNRCKRLHPLFATALQIIHFKQYLNSRGHISDECMALLNAFSSAPSPGSLSTLIDSSAIENLLGSYAQYCDETRAGRHGATAQYWMMYIDLVHLYLLLDRACRTNDTSLFIFALGEMIPMFFATHRPNYARWMTRYHLNLMNMEHTHPGIRDVFDAGALSIRRTGKSFARSAVDLTLEQTVNKDAASRHGGIAAFTQNVNARKRWTVTRSFRGAVVSCLLEMAGLTAPEEVSRELTPARIEKDNSHLQDLIREIEGTQNPFIPGDDKLYCLATGKAASDNVKDDLLQLQEKGSEWHQQFVNECKEDPERFEKPIKRQKVKNFAQDAVKMKVPVKDKKIREVSCTRDLFGRLTYLAVTQKIDLGIVLSHPLTPVPFSLCHITGDMNKTAKSKFMEKLEALGTAANIEPNSIDAYLIDAMFFIRTLPLLPSSFGGVARSILQRACTNAKTIHLICDTYPDGPSIKDQEHDNRGCSLMHSYKITGPLQKRPADFQNALKSADFKRELLSFLKDEWIGSSYASILEGHQLYYATGQECFLFTSNGRQVERITVNDLWCTHEEADTRLVFHANFVAASEEMPVVVVRSIDTDVFILLLYHAKYINAKLWMDAGVDSKSTRRLIDISGLAENITPVVCEALPSFHAFTGCDFTAAFMRKAKLKPYEIMVKNERFMKALSMLGTSDKIDMDVAATLEEYVCYMYGLKNAQRTNDARLQLFKQLYAPKKQSGPLEKIKSSDPCCLPPCRAVLEEKLKRTNHVSFIWKNARSAEPVGFGPIGHGWKVDDNNRLAMVWFECPRVPRNLSVDDFDCDDENEEDGTLTPSLSSDEEESDDET